MKNILILSILVSLFSCEKPKDISPVTPDEDSIPVKPPIEKPEDYTGVLNIPSDINVYGHWVSDKSFKFVCYKDSTVKFPSFWELSKYYSLSDLVSCDYYTLTESKSVSTFERVYEPYSFTLITPVNKAYIKYSKGNTLTFNIDYQNNTEIETSGSDKWNKYINEEYYKNKNQFSRNDTLFVVTNYVHNKNDYYTLCTIYKRKK